MVDFDERTHYQDQNVGSAHVHQRPGAEYEQLKTGIAADIAALEAGEDVDRIDAELDQFDEGGQLTASSDGAAREQLRSTLQRYGVNIAGTSLGAEATVLWNKVRTATNTASRGPQVASKQEQDDPIGLADGNPLTEDQGIADATGLDQALTEPLAEADGLSEPIAVEVEGPLLDPQILPSGVEMDLRDGMENPLEVRVADGVDESFAVEEEQGIAGLTGTIITNELDQAEAIDTRIGQQIAATQVQPGVQISAELPPGVEFALRGSAGATEIEPSPVPRAGKIITARDLMHPIELETDSLQELEAESAPETGPGEDVVRLARKIAELPPGFQRYYLEKLTKDDFSLSS